MAKLYDIVNTSKMSMEFDGSLIDVEHKASTALENGRLVAILNDGTCRYAVSGDAKVYLHASVEVIPETFRGLTEFRRESGEYARVLGMCAGDIFATTAFTGTAVAVGDKVILGTNGVLNKATPVGTENFIAEVIALGTLGFDLIPSITVRVTKA